MPTETTALEARKNQRLQPSEDLRRPNQHGQMPHVFTTFPDLLLGQLEIDDILEINWSGVETAVRDAIVRVRHEGDLSSATLRETIQLIALALRKLEADDADLQRRVRSDIGFWERRRTRKRIRALGETRETLFNLRIELAGEVDRRIGDLLMLESSEYRGLQQRLASQPAIRGTARGILDELAEIEKLDVRVARQYHDRYVSVETYEANRRRLGQLKEKLPAFIGFVALHMKRTVESRGEVEICLKQLIAEIEAQTLPVEGAMEAMRDARKHELYAQAATAIDETTCPP